MTHRLVTRNYLDKSTGRFRNGAVFFFIIYDNSVVAAVHYEQVGGYCETLRELFFIKTIVWDGSVSRVKTIHEPTWT